jgi:indole-3-acetate monooxygenase
MTTAFKERNAGKDAANQLLADIEELAPDIRCGSAEMEATGRIPIDLIESLRAIGVFRMFVPRSHGGFELDFIDGVEIIQPLARIDGSVGWSVMISVGGSVFATLLLPETYDRIYEQGPDVMFAGSLKPNGKAESTDNGWRLTGRWDFASGCQHADWMFGTFVMSRDGVELVRPPNGQKVTRGCIVPAQDWKIKETCKSTSRRI